VEEEAGGEGVLGGEEGGDAGVGVEGDVGEVGNACAGRELSACGGEAAEGEFDAVRVAGGGGELGGGLDAAEEAGEGEEEDGREHDKEEGGIAGRGGAMRHRIPSLRLEAAPAGEGAGAGAFGAADLLFIEAEVVGDFVPDGFLDELAEFGFIAGHPFVGTLEDGDAVGEGDGFKAAAEGEGASFIEAEETGAGRFGFDDEDEVFEAGAEARGDDAHGVVHEAVEVAGVHGLALL
jgi:hypothetical protein